MIIVRVAIKERALQEGTNLFSFSRSSKRWLGEDADATAVYILLKTPKLAAMAAFTGICSGEYILTAVSPVALAPCAAEKLSDYRASKVKRACTRLSADGL